MQKHLPPSLLAWCNNWLETSRETVARVDPLPVEASHRQFYRMHTRRRSLVLMCSPPDLERNEAFLSLADLFQQHQLHVPAIYHVDRAAGWMLMEDLGDMDLEAVYAGSARSAAIQSALKLLPRLAAVRSPLIEPYTEARMQMEVGLFNEWFTGQLLDVAGYEHGSEGAYAELINAMLEQPQGCVHRDYHCRNLLYLPADAATGAGAATDAAPEEADADPQQIGLVDFQDALHGPILYDPASLLRDCYYVFSEAEVARWLQLYISLQPDLQGYKPQQIRTWFDYTAMQRQLKAVGIFARLHLRDGKSSHLGYIPGVLNRLHTLSRQYPALQALSLQLDDCIKKLAHLPLFKEAAQPAP